MTAIQTVFNKIHDIAGLLQKVDSSKERESFEAEYEKLLDGFYSELLEIDEMIGSDVPTEEQFLDRLKRLIKAGRCFDDLWDMYHSERLDVVQFSKLLD